jgi:hypothetical protein
MDIPQRLHRVCVLLWRLPKLEVPFAVSQSQSRSQSNGVIAGSAYSLWIRNCFQLDVNHEENDRVGVYIPRGALMVS